MSKCKYPLIMPHGLSASTMLRNSLLFVILFFAAPAFALPSVNVLADKSMSVALTQIALSYSKNRNVVVNNSFTAPREQQELIQEGGAADVLITPMGEWINELKQQGLVDVYSVRDIAENRLVLVGPVDSPLRTMDMMGFPAEDIARQIGFEPGFVVGHPETLEEGSYAREALRNLQVADYLEPYMLYPKKLDQMFELIASRGAYGVFLESSLVGRNGVRVFTALPSNSHRPIIYKAVVIAGDNMEQARDFLAYLNSASAQKLLREHGFTVSAVTKAH